MKSLAGREGVAGRIAGLSWNGWSIIAKASATGDLDPFAAQTSSGGFWDRQPFSDKG